MLTKALELSVEQQSKVRRLLQWQREENRRAWDDQAIPAAQRVAATQAISDRTADALRALLSEEQKKRFRAPKPAREPQANSDKRSVEEWMNATQPKKQENR
jgi:hypothetical protein